MRSAYVALYLIALASLGACTGGDFTRAVNYPESRFEPEAR